MKIEFVLSLSLFIMGLCPASLGFPSPPITDSLPTIEQLSVQVQAELRESQK